jgi:hypothetical protein
MLHMGAFGVPCHRRARPTNWPRIGAVAGFPPEGLRKHAEPVPNFRRVHLV